MPKIMIVYCASSPEYQSSNIPLSYLDTQDREKYVFEVSEDELKLIQSYFKGKNTCYTYYKVFVLEEKQKFSDLIDLARKDDAKAKKKIEDHNRKSDALRKKREESRRIREERKEKELYYSLKQKIEPED